MTKLEKYLKEVEARCEAATKGPWKVEHEMNEVGIDKPFFVHNLINKSWEKTALPDAEFIAHARTDVEVLLELVKEVRRQATGNMYYLPKDGVYAKQHRLEQDIELESLIPKNERANND